MRKLAVFNNTTLDGICARGQETSHGRPGASVV